MSTITPQPNIRYQDFLHDIKAQVAQSRIGAVRAVNRSLIGLYWLLGKMIVERQEDLGWVTRSSISYPPICATNSPT